jgi:hypothetical protein
VKALDFWPAGTVGGSDFVTGRATINRDAGERIVNLEVDLDAMPAWGLLAIHQDTVRNILLCLGWPTPDGYAELEAHLTTCRADAALLRERLAELEAERDEAVMALRAVTKITTKAGNRAAS